MTWQIKQVVLFSGCFAADTNTIDKGSSQLYNIIKNSWLVPFTTFCTSHNPTTKDPFLRNNTDMSKKSKDRLRDTAL